MKIWGVFLAGGPLPKLPNARTDWGNYPNSYLQNLANDRPARSVRVHCRSVIWSKKGSCTYNCYFLWSVAWMNDQLGLDKNVDHIIDQQWMKTFYVWPRAKLNYAKIILWTLCIVLLCCLKNRNITVIIAPLSSLFFLQAVRQIFLSRERSNWMRRISLAPIFFCWCPNALWWNMITSIDLDN